MELREYQRSIVEKALRKNTLVVLPTGLGKTIIAIAVSKEKLREGDVLVMAPTRPLVEQHSKTFMEWGLEGTVITGKIRKEKRRILWEKGRVFFATPQTVLSDLNDGILDLKRFSLLVFDEAHRAVGEYSYVKIAKEYVKKRENGLILALTASPGSSPERILEVCRNLYIGQIEFRTERSPDVVKYVKEKITKTIVVELPPELEALRREIRESLKERLSVLKEYGVIDSSSPSRVKLTELIELQGKLENPSMEVYLAQAIKLYHLLKIVESYGVKEGLEFLRRMEGEIKKSNILLLRDEKLVKIKKMLEELYEKGVLHPKLRELLRLLRERRGKKVIVFVNLKRTAEFLEDFLNRNGFFSRKFVGQREGMSQREQIETLRMFKEGKFDILISTSIGEEGLHIPDVDTVIFYEPVPSALRSIQRKGRTGRTRFGEIIILVTKGTMDSGYYFISKRKEREMIRSLLIAKRMLEGESQKSLLDFGVIKR